MVCERIHLEDDMAPAALLLVLDFTPNQCLDPLEKVDGRNEQFAVALLCGVAGEMVEQVGRVRAQGLVAGQQAQVGVEAGRHDIVVASAEMGVAADLVAFLAHHQSKLRMNLEAQQAIDDMDALRFQPAGPFDVGFFVETGLQFDQHRHLFAALVRLKQTVDDGRISPHAIERHLDREYVGILRRLAQKIDHWIEGIERMMQQHIATADHAKEIRAVVELRI